MNNTLGNGIASAMVSSDLLHLCSFFDALDEGFVAIDSNFTIKQSNQWFKSMVCNDALTSSQLLYYFDETQQEIIKSNTQLVNKTGKAVFELLFTAQGGKQLPLLCKQVLLPTLDNTPQCTYLVLSNVGEQKQKELQVQNQMRQLEQSLASSQEQTRFAEEKIRQHNEEIATQHDLLQFQNEMLNDQINELKAAEEEIKQTNEEIVSQRDLLQFQNEMLSEHINELTAAEEEIRTQRDALQQQTEDLQETLVQLQQSQAKLVESEKMVALGQLIAGVAHEINTPLGAIRSSVGNISNILSPMLLFLPSFFEQLTEAEKTLFFDLLNTSLQRRATITSKEERTYKRKIIQSLEENAIVRINFFADTLVDMGVYENIEPLMPSLKENDSKQLIQTVYKLSGLLRSTQTISVATERASKVVFALKNFAHFNHTGEMVLSNVIDTIETVLTLYHNQIKQGIVLSKHYEEVPNIFCYPDELTQVWTNIIHNALQAMDYVGNLQIAVTQDSLHLYVSITDSGKGIPAEIQDKIFNVFFTTKPQGEGSGLGLDIVRRIIEKHLGKISFTSQPGATTFTVKLTKTIGENN